MDTHDAHDEHGLPGAAAVLLAVAVGTAAGVVDVLTGPGLRTLFAVSFIASCVVAALVVRRRDLRTVVFMPPLAYALVALITSEVRGSAGGGSFLMSRAMDLFTALVVGAPALLVATGATVAVALFRGAARRRELV